MRQFVLIAFIVILSRSSSEAQSIFRAGVARTDITPPVVELWGYSNRSGPATGTLDPLYARVLVVSDGAHSVARDTRSRPPFWSSADRCPPLRVRSEHLADEVMLMASHTHSAPVIEDEYAEIPGWEKRALDKIVLAIREAHARLVPARIGTGFGQATIGHNRRVISPMGARDVLAKQHVSTNGPGRSFGRCDSCK